MDRSGERLLGLIKMDAGLINTDADRSQSLEAYRSLCIDNVVPDRYSASRERNAKLIGLLGKPRGLSGVPRSVCIGLHRQKITPYGEALR